MSWKQIIGFSFAAGSAFLYLIYSQQEKILYLNETIPPKRTSENPIPFANPAQQGLKYKEVWLTTADNLKLHAWWIPFNKKMDPSAIYKPITVQSMMASIANENTLSSDEEKEDISKSSIIPTIIFFHANAGNMGYRLPNLRAMHERLTVNLFIFSYRGYGESEGVPNEKGIMLDAECAFDYVYNEIPNINRNRIFLFGRSLGGAVAIYTALQNNDRIAGLIVENTFSSISEMVGKVFPFLNFEFIKKYMLKIHWRSCDRILDISAPMLFFAGDMDEIVPHQQMLKLFSLAKDAKEKDLMVIKGGTHNDSWMKGGYEYWERIQIFIEKHECSTDVNENVNDKNDEQKPKKVDIVKETSSL